MLSALLAHRETRGVDLSRITHHAAAVGDEATIVQYGPLAQWEATAAGSHREAVAHGRLVLAHRSAFAAGELAEILGRHAIECYATNQPTRAHHRRGRPDLDWAGPGPGWARGQPNGSGEQRI